MSYLTSGKLTSTLNWDTVFAISAAKVNEDIVNKKVSPLTFSYSSEKKDWIKGNFGDWQIVKGGDGALIYMSIPVYHVAGSTSLGDFNWEKGSVIIEVGLAYLPHTDEIRTSAINSATQPYALKINTSSNDPTRPIVSLKTTLFTTKPTGTAVDNVGSSYVEAIIPSFIVAWLNENIKDFNHVFAIVNLNHYIDKDKTWAWTKPTYIDYAYADGNTLQDSVLGVLCMTGGRVGTVEQIQLIDSVAMPTGSIAVYLLSEERVLEDLILPTLPLKWKNASKSDFEVVPNGDTETGRYQHVLQLKKEVSIKLENITHNGDNYTPYLKKFKIALEDDQIILETYTETVVSLGVTSYCDAIHWYTIELGHNKNGQTLIFRATKKPQVNHGTTETLAAEVLKIFEVTLAALATIVLGVLTDGAGFAVGAVVIGLLTGIAVSEPSIIENANQDTSPSIDLLTFNATNAIQWSSSGGFHLNFAGLNGPLQLSGNLAVSSNS